MKKVSPTYARIANDEHGQYVILPENFSFPEGVTQVTVEKRDDSLLISPAKKDWLSLSESPDLDETFLTERPDIF